MERSTQLQAWTCSSKPTVQALTMRSDDSESTGLSRRHLDRLQRSLTYLSSSVGLHHAPLGLRVDQPSVGLRNSCRTSDSVNQGVDGRRLCRLSNPTGADSLNRIRSA